ncbi:hypothetical protein LTR70_003111 [Exophiala xenobiotica]|uniref:Cytochrome P450 n=1 Tax=Lithohypha guttulata TaxID=1690604 RepID=A0ABR0KHI5_9EURO|nr:hypothetical protein LTR24_002656 [Lithohypha guttulata]KAK5323822.1 hypothetical protein LTR70_003111 [Exophiala xenobiotica]
MSASTTYSTAFTVLNVLSIALLSALLLFAGIYLFSYIKFQLDFHKFNAASDGTNLRAPHLPFAIPWVGNAPSFLSMTPHKFWSELFSWYPRSAGACSITLGGNPTAVIFNAPASQYLLRDRKLGRDQFNVQITSQGLGLSLAESELYYQHHTPVKQGELPGHVENDKIHVEYMLKTERVNEMTAEFVHSLRQQVSQELKDTSGEISLNKWLRRIMFHASTTALLGSKILEVIPDLEHLFFQFDQDMLSMFFGLPKFMIPKQVANRDKAVNAYIKWHETVAKESDGKIVDPEGVAWEPLYGSRLNRARQLGYRKKNLPVRAASGLDLGMTFGISSNAIPAAGWMLMHILDSTRPENKVKGEPTLYEHIMSELADSQNPDGTLNIPTLINQPILLSTLHEVLRIYVDTLVSRQVPTDLSLPLSHAPSPTPGSQKEQPQRSLFLKAGSLMMMPTYPAHTNPDTWQNPDQPPPNIFFPYRFLTAPPTATASDKPIFTTAPYNGMFFPFGGGKTICPGRVFAKQEIIASVAVVLLAFEFDVLGYVDGKGKATGRFPGLRDTLPGSAVMVASGDVRVNVKRRVPNE